MSESHVFERFPREEYVVTPSGNYAIDCDRGEQLARQLLARMRRDNAPHYLGWVIRDLLEDSQAHAHTGIVVGLCREFAVRAMRAV